MAESFLEENKLDMVVRSHECVEEGFDLPFEDDMDGEVFVERSEEGNTCFCGQSVWVATYFVRGLLFKDWRKGMMEVLFYLFSSHK